MLESVKTLFIKTVANESLAALRLPPVPTNPPAVNDRLITSAVNDPLNRYAFRRVRLRVGVPCADLRQGTDKTISDAIAKNVIAP